MKDIVKLHKLAQLRRELFSINNDINYKYRCGAKVGDLGQEYIVKSKILDEIKELEGEEK